MDPELVRLLVSRGALVNLANVHAQTPLMDLASHCTDVSNFADVYAALRRGGDPLAPGLNPHLTNCAHNTALDQALIHGKPGIANCLIEEANKTLMPTTVSVKPVPLRITDHDQDYSILRYRCRFYFRVMMAQFENS